MEELIMFLLEILLEILISLPLDYANYKYDKKKGGYVEGISFYILFGVISGCIIGVVSLSIFPNALLPFGWLRITNLILAPFLAGGILGAIAIAFSRKREYVFPKAHFWSAFCFVLSLALIRFLGIEK